MLRAHPIPDSIRRLASVWLPWLVNDHMRLFKAEGVASDIEFLCKANEAAARERAVPDAPDAPRYGSRNLVVMAARERTSCGASNTVSLACSTELTHSLALISGISFEMITGPLLVVVAVLWSHGISIFAHAATDNRRVIPGTVRGHATVGSLRSNGRLLVTVSWQVVQVCNPRPHGERAYEPV